MSNFIQLEEIIKEVKEIKQDVNKIGILVSITLLIVCILTINLF